MSSAGLRAPAVVYLLADHLDSALAAGEDLLKSSLSWNGGDSRLPDDLAAHRRAEREAIENARSLEMVLLARVLKSRQSATELSELESRFKPLAKLYVGGTDLIADAAGEITDATEYAFDAGDGVTAYLRARGLLADDEAAPLDAASLPITEDFRVAGRLPLGSLLDMVAMFLDALETHYELYDEPVHSDTGPTSSASPTTGAIV